MVRVNYETLSQYKESMSLIFSVNVNMLNAFNNQVLEIASASYYLSIVILDQTKDFSEADEKFFLKQCQAMLDTLYYIDKESDAIRTTLEFLTLIRDNAKSVPIPEQYKQFKNARDLRRKVMENTIKYIKKYYDGHYEEFKNSYNSFLAEERILEDRMLQKYWENNSSEYAIFKEIYELLRIKIDAQYEVATLGAFAFSKKKTLDEKIADLQQKISGRKEGLVVVDIKELEQKIRMEKNRGMKEVSNSRVQQ